MATIINPTWTAQFPGGVLVSVSDEDWWIEGADPVRVEEVTNAIVDAATYGWPSIAGMSMNTDPGWNPEWNYMRLTAMGAMVTGPWPQAVDLEQVPPEGTIVG